jgi:ABC-type antimicrobial peptide transport system permease subunit
MEIPLIAGRDFTPFDRSDSPPVVLINETAAKSLFPGEDPLGRQVRSGGRDVAWEVVGVVADVHHLTPEQDPGLEVYFPIAQLGDFSTLDLVVRSRLPPATLAAAVSGALAELDPAMPTRDFWTLSSTLDRSLSPRRFTLQVLGAFGVVALLLAALGIYGVLSQSVAERTHEIGIRMSLGASAGSVRRSVVLRTLLLAAAGIGIGVLAALPGTRLLSSLLYDVPNTDPVTLLSMAGVLLAVAGLSGLVPAIRASRTNALRVLRGE